MKLVGYLYKKFIGVFIGALAFFVMALSLTDLLLNLWNYISKAVPLATIGTIMLYYLPKTVWYSIPIATLFSTAYTLSDLYANNELTAIFASGISLFRFTAPLLLFAIAMSFGMFFFDDNVVVPTYATKQQMQKEVFHREQSLNNDRIVIMSEEGNIIYKADLYDDKQQRLFGLYIVFRDEDKSLDAIIRADSALWQKDHWVLSGSTEYRVKGNEITTSSVDKKLSSRLVEPPETFRNNTVNVEEVNTKEARAYIEHLQKAGLPSGEAVSLYYKKYSFPFIVFIVVFLAIGLSGKTQKNVLLVSLALSIGATVLFYVLQMVTMIMAKWGAIPPFFGAWFPVFLFTLISIVLLNYART
jgi:lipopolysaccharide export system permease protein